MDRETIVARLRAHEPELKRAGISALSLFGSAARGEAGPASDIDLAAVVDPAARIGVFEFVGLEHRLSEILGRPVDLVSEPARKARLQREIDGDRVRAF